jgi:hypothetical protein
VQIVHSLLSTDRSDFEYSLSIFPQLQRRFAPFVPEHTRFDGGGQICKSTLFSREHLNICAWNPGHQSSICILEKMRPTSFADHTVRLGKCFASGLNKHTIVFYGGMARHCECKTSLARRLGHPAAPQLWPDKRAFSKTNPGGCGKERMLLCATSASRYCVLKGKIEVVY